MEHGRLFWSILLVTLAASATAASWRVAATGESMTGAATKFLASLDDKQRIQSTMPFESPKRADWHFIPKNERKGLQIKDMNESQRAAALALLRTTLSQVGYDKALKVMELEKVLAELEKSKEGGNIRDSQRYYYTLFGKPAADSKWGLSIEGHHLSLNFAVEGNRVISSTPTFFAANPAEMKSDIAGVKKGLRILAREEQIGFDLVNSLDAKQKTKAIIDKKAPREIRGAGERATPKDERVGVSYAELNEEQKKTMRSLVGVYASNMPEDVRNSRIQRILKGGPENVHFAWAGALKPGVGHYYRIQGPSFLIEFVNTQPDPAGNPANHIHCVWRDGEGDFSVPQQ